jgi:hypothetical protein
MRDSEAKMPEPASDLRAVLNMKFKSDDCGGKYTASQTCGDSTIDIERMPIDEG